MQMPGSRSAQGWLQIVCWILVAVLAVVYIFTGWEPALYVGAAFLLANAVARTWPEFRHDRRQR